MRSLILPRDLAADARAGVVFIALLLPSRDRPPVLGDHIALRADDPKKAGARALGTTACVARARLVLTPAGVVRVIGPAVATGAAGDRARQILSGLESSDARSASCLAAFLPAVGFASYDGLYRDQLAINQSANKRAPRGRLVRELVAWAAVQ